jgi:two-component system CheB/CheR fusion protein
MARLLDDLLEVSRVTQNKIELRRCVVDLRQIAAEAAEAVRSQAEEKRLELKTNLEEEPLSVFGDPTRLQQIQINLLNNAVKYTRPGGTISLWAGRDDNQAVIRVKDTGDGIPPQMLDSVFELFVQARHTLDHSEGGLGVGLTLVRALVEMHGGTVSARSDGDGTGSEFAVRLPLTTLATSPDALQDSSLSAPPAGTTVVVVEDNADSREMLCTMLTHTGLSCYGAADGWAALRLIDEVSPEIVLLDVGLPGMDGLEVARRVRANPRHRGVRLIALTGYGQASDRQATREAGFDYHLVKPVQPEELLAVLAHLRTSSSSPNAVLPSNGIQTEAPSVGRPRKDAPPQLS